jgi:hypothetical protein
LHNPGINLLSLECITLYDHQCAEDNVYADDNCEETRNLAVNANKEEFGWGIGRCMLVTMDDGTLRLFGLDNGGSNTPFTGKPYSGTQLQGLQSYFCSSFSLWAAQASRALGTFSPPSLPPSACFIYQKHILLLVILWTPLMLSYDLLFHCIHGLLTVK